MEALTFLPWEVRRDILNGIVHFKEASMEVQKFWLRILKCQTGACFNSSVKHNLQKHKYPWRHTTVLMCVYMKGTSFPWMFIKNENTYNLISHHFFVCRNWANNTKMNTGTIINMSVAPYIRWFRNRSSLQQIGS